MSVLDMVVSLGYANNILWNCRISLSNESKAILSSGHSISSLNDYSKFVF